MTGPRTGHGRAILLAHPSAELYGSDRVLLESVAGLVGGPEKVIVTVPGPGPLVDQLTALGAEVRFCPSPVLRKSALRPRGALALLAEVVRSVGPGWSLLRGRRVGVVLVNTVTIPLWTVLARLAGCRLVVHVHEAERSAPRPVRVALAAPLLLAHRIVANSEFSVGVLAGAIPRLRRRTRVIYNGIVGPADPPPPRERLTGPITLVYVGRLSPRKGPAVAVQALAELTRRGVEARLRLVGAVFEGYEWFETELGNQVRELGLAERVEFTGFRPEVWPEIAAADIMLVPSEIDEPFGNTAVEAVLARRPAVVSATAGLLEAAAGYRAVILVPPSDPIAIAEAVTRICAEWPEFRELVEQDRQLALRRHSPAGYRSRLAETLIGLPEPAGPAEPTEPIEPAESAEPGSRR